MRRKRSHPELRPRLPWVRLGNMRRRRSLPAVLTSVRLFIGLVGRPVNRAQGQPIRWPVSRMTGAFEHCPPVFGEMLRLEHQEPVPDGYTYRDRKQR
jgi:hypothetical protein